MCSVVSHSCIYNNYTTLLEKSTVKYINNVTMAVKIGTTSGASNGAVHDALLEALNEVLCDNSVHLAIVFCPGPF